MPPALLFLRWTLYVGENEVGGESWVLNDIDASVPLYLHIQAVRLANCSPRPLFGRASGIHQGIGVLEQLVIGPCQPPGFKDLMDVATDREQRSQ